MADDYLFFRLEGDNGLSYVRHLHDAAERADKFMFEITRNNFLAFSALGSFGTAGLFSITSNRFATVLFVCIVIISVSLGSSMLSYFYHRYSSYLYSKAWIAEKAWLRGKRSDRLLEALHRENQAFKLFGQRQDGDVKRRPEKRRTIFYVVANAVPAAAGVVIIIAICFGLELQPPPAK